MLLRVVVVVCRCCCCLSLLFCGSDTFLFVTCCSLFLFLVFVLDSCAVAPSPSPSLHTPRRHETSRRDLLKRCNNDVLVVLDHLRANLRIQLAFKEDYEQELKSTIDRRRSVHVRRCRSGGLVEGIQHSMLILSIFLSGFPSGARIEKIHGRQETIGNVVG